MVITQNNKIIKPYSVTSDSIETAPSEVMHFLRKKNFHRICFRDLRVRFWGREIMHYESTKLGMGVFSFLVTSQFRRPIELKFSQICYFMIFVDSYTLSEKIGLWNFTKGVNLSLSKLLTELILTVRPIHKWYSKYDKHLIPKLSSIVLCSVELIWNTSNEDYFPFRICVCILPH